MLSETKGKLYKLKKSLIRIPIKLVGARNDI